MARWRRGVRPSRIRPPARWSSGTRPCRSPARSPSATSPRPAASMSAGLPANISDSLRFLARCPFGPGTLRPCLLALMRDPESDEPIGIQRIALELQEGRVCKIDRMALGRIGVVKLWPAGPTLVVGEGLETTLAAATRIPYRGAAAAAGLVGGLERRLEPAAVDLRASSA